MSQSKPFIAKLSPNSKTVILKLETVKGRKTATFFRPTGLDIGASEMLAVPFHDEAAPEERFGIELLSPVGDSNAQSVICADRQGAWSYAALHGYKPIALAGEVAA